MNQRILVLTVLSLTGCGGGSGGGGGPPPPTISLTILSTPDRDGMIVDATFVFPTFDLQVGDSSSDNPKRGFLSFSHATIPPGAVLVSATLRVHQSGVHGTPYADLGNVIVDHIDIGPALDPTDFASPAILDSFATLSTDGTLVYRTLDVSARMAADLAAARGHTDFRLHTTPATDSDGSEDSSYWNDAEDTDANGNVPQLVIEYHL
jgi:hypothetical protein